MVRNLPVNARDKGDVGSIPGLGRSSGGETATHSSILAWKIPATEEPREIQSMRSQRFAHDWDHTHTHTQASMHRVCYIGYEQGIVLNS